MTIQVTDTNTGQALTVTDVNAELARLDDTAGFGRLYLNEIRGNYTQAAEDVAHTLTSGANELRALANDLAGGVWDIDPEPEPVVLRPDPTLALAPGALDAEHRAAEAERERRRRATVLAPVGQRAAFVPDVPKLSRWQRVVGWLSDSGGRAEGWLRRIGEDRGQA